MKKKEKPATINFKINLDPNNIPEEITWQATDSQNNINKAKAVIISVWDGEEKTSFKIDLWTKEMMAEEMKFFIVQILDSLSDTYKKSVGDDKVAMEMKQFTKRIGKMSNVLK